MNDFDRAYNNILIVDDIPDNLAILSRILKERGYSVRPAINGQLALKAARHVPPDLILLDIMMPGMDGYEVCRQLKSDERTRDIPILFISALDETLNKLKAFQSGGVDYVIKPFEAQEVLARVETHLAIRQMQTQLQHQNVQLQQEIQERKRMEQALRQYSRELVLFNEMSSRLQTCRTEQDTYVIIADICQKLFPSDSGYIAMMQNSDTTCREVAAWGDYVATFRDFEPGACPALQQAHPPSASSAASGYRCPHLQESSNNPSRCLAIPISTTTQTLGILALITKHTESSVPNEAEEDEDLEKKWMLANGIIEHYALVLTNLRLRETLRVEAIRDPLTGLFNRRYMEESLRREAQRADRNSTSIGIIMIDIDHFKKLNDSFGHEAGDIMLRHLGTLLSNNIRGGDIACRYGGEEFLLILPEVRLDVVSQRAQELLSQIRALNIVYQKMRFSITVSIGIATYPGHGETVQQVVIAADMALYQAKRQGRDQLVIAGTSS